MCHIIIAKNGSLKEWHGSWKCYWGSQDLLREIPNFNFCLILNITKQMSLKSTDATFTFGLLLSNS